MASFAGFGQQAVGQIGKGGEAARLDPCQFAEPAKTPRRKDVGQAS
jgi:hypothetical protein